MLFACFFSQKLAEIMSKHAGKNAETQPYQRESLIKLQAWVNKEVRVRFSGGRTITGVLRGFDTSNNMIVDDTIEYIRGIKYLIECFLM